MNHYTPFSNSSNSNLSNNNYIVISRYLIYLLVRLSPLLEIWNLVQLISSSCVFSCQTNVAYNIKLLKLNQNDQPMKTVGLQKALLNTWAMSNPDSADGYILINLDLYPYVASEKNSGRKIFSQPFSNNVSLNFMSIFLLWSLSFSQRFASILGSIISSQFYVILIDAR